MTKKIPGLIAIFVVASATGLAQTQTPVPHGPVPIFITSVGATNGLTDPSKDNQDSVKDAENALNGHKALTLAPSRDVAAIVLVIQNRGSGNAIAVGPTSVAECTLRAKFVYQGTESELSGSIGCGVLGGPWKKAAGRLIDQVDAWVKANIK